MLVARLRDEKYKNNIIKNITDAIPIELVVYNHMFNIYLQNYRFGFSYELKNKIDAILRKYYNINPLTYPTDLFEIDDDSQLYTILENVDPKNRYYENININTKNKIKSAGREIQEIDNQLKSLQEEKRTLTDPDKIQMVDEITARLNNAKMSIQNKISTLEPPAKEPVDNYLIAAYKTSANQIKNNAYNRGLSVIDFYNLALGK